MLSKKLRRAVSALFALVLTLSTLLPVSAQVMANREVPVMATASADISSETDIPEVSLPTGFNMKTEEEQPEKAKTEHKKADAKYVPSFGYKVVKKPSTITELMLASYEPMGRFKLSFYCPCRKCNGNSHGITASGTKVTEGRTIAVDKRKIPLGSVVHIDGFGDFIAEDTGSSIKGNRIDILVSSHARARQLGIKYAGVYIKVS